jgi:purine-binding chemotaxis protein CheW
VSPPREAERRPEDALVELCAFLVGQEEYVLDIRRIREIVQPLPVTAVPRAPAWMEGVIDLRGEVLPLLDVRKRLGLAPRTSSRRAKILVVNVAGRVLGLLVDGVSEVVRIPRSAIGPPPALMPAAGGARLFLGVVGSRAAAGQVRPGRSSRPAPARVGRGRGGSAVERLRLLLNVKALIDPSVAAAPAGAASAPDKERRTP